MGCYCIYQMINQWQTYIQLFTLYDIPFFLNNNLISLIKWINYEEKRSDIWANVACSLTQEVILYIQIEVILMLLCRCSYGVQKWQVLRQQRVSRIKLLMFHLQPLRFRIRDCPSKDGVEKAHLSDMGFQWSRSWCLGQLVLVISCKAG